MVDKPRPQRLTHRFIMTAAPARYGDGPGGNGLSIAVKLLPNGRTTRTWSQRVRINGKPTNLGLGSFPAVSLAMARAKAADHVRRIAQGEDVRKPPPQVPTVDEVIADMIRARTRPDTKEQTKAKWQRHKAYCSPIGSTPVSDVTTADVLAIVEPLWLEKDKTARDVLGFLSAAMRRAVRHGHRTTNPAPSDLVEDLGRPTPTAHHRALPHAEVGHYLAIIRDTDEWWAVKWGLIFLAITCVRSINVCTATWDQFDLESEVPTWHIPADQMKNGLDHDVPLSTLAVEIALYAEEMTGGAGFVFPAERGKQHMDGARFSHLMKRLKIPAVPHGFRSSHRNWAGGRPDIAERVAERVLSHKPRDQTVEAYLNSPMFPERIPVMQLWTDHILATMGPFRPTP